MKILTDSEFCTVKNAGIAITPVQQTAYATTAEKEIQELQRKGRKMSDVRLLLKEKADIETAMQRDLAPHIRAFAQQELDKVCKQIEEEWNKLFEPQEIDQLKARVTELEASNKDLLEALKDCCVIARPGNPYSCCPVYRPGEHGGCSENEDGECHIWKAIQKARGQG